MHYENIREEELKNKIAKDYFWRYDCTKIIGNVDFCVSFFQSVNDLFEHESLLWAEAKKGSSDIYKSVVQLILTIGKARTFDKNLPPSFLGAFDAEKIAFIPYNEIHDIFYQTDFNWNVAPSNYETKEFQLVYDKVRNIIDSNVLLFHFGKDDKDIHRFIKENFIVGKFGISKIRIDKNNFVAVYNKWHAEVKPTIAVNWEVAKKKGIIDGDFYLADLLSYDNITLKDKLYVVLKAALYQFNRHVDEFGAFTSSSVEFNDKQKAHIQFWNRYERPPKEEYWDYIVERRDLLVPQDVRERKGSFFTPQIWVEMSQKYLADVLGDNWQDEYYVWDCAAGTGNLLTGLTNKYNIWASTLDTQDVEVMKDRIKNGANLLEDHVFQFDFLNDEFEKLPKQLYKIINDPEKRKKLVIYINPPYAESGSGVGRGFKLNVALENKTHNTYQKKLGNASNEIFIQFLARIYDKINNSILAHFSKLKLIQGPNFIKFRDYFYAKYLGGFISPANTFDNVKGRFPIGFMIWDLTKKYRIDQSVFDVYDYSGHYLGKKTYHSYDNEKGYINDWLKEYYDKKSIKIGILHNNKNDFQHNIQVRITTSDIKDHTTPITQSNIIQMSIYFAVRHCIEATWLNDRDQFLYPNDGWKNDTEYQNDCLAYSLFHSQNRISSKEGINHWIPFAEYEVFARDKFDSNFMINFIKGKEERFVVEEPPVLYSPSVYYGNNADDILRKTPIEFSKEAKAVFDSGREIWGYYHSQKFPSIGDYNVNASLYDIKEYFQGRNDKGKMNNKSSDKKYNSLIANLREQLKILAKKIEPKVYEYGFLKK